MNRENLRDVLTVKEVQEFLNISRNTAYEIIQQELFPVLRIGRSIRINKIKFLEWFDSDAA